ncbi:LPXTG cell wall anchor domain-containing protein [Brochothrix thermosphacta]|uniref:LPXTG cell wall anchor domain-containing protein n=1 Tax=Brochothrix thermosphacta TaxID=2756 RepID=UPI0013C47D50|nr:LPXTG cell wall anchor domain-containing protein [Brochothrix thermosphacta]
MLIKVKIMGLILGLSMIFPYSAQAESTQSKVGIEFTGKYEEVTKETTQEIFFPNALPQTGDHMSLKLFFIGMLFIYSALIIMMQQNKKNKKETR